VIGLAEEIEKRIEELRRQFEETVRSVGALIVAGCIAGVVIVGAGAYVWFTKVEHHSSGHHSSGHEKVIGFDVKYIDLATGKTTEKTIAEREQYDLYELQREGKISIISIRPVKA